MNERFVCVKVDREERPDLDGIYMEAVQAMTGHGGWPLNVFLTPDQEPFFGGTYWPPTPRHGMPCFAPGAEAVAETVARARARGARRGAPLVTERLREQSTAQGAQARAAPGTARRARWRRCVAVLRPAPRRFRRRPEVPAALRARSARCAAASARRGARDAARDGPGGICDQVGGGFARYAVDRTWTVPHFEKMLYDNALLARAYLHALAAHRRAAASAHLPRDARLLPARAARS